VFPIHYSRALLRAFGFLPVEVWGPPARPTTLGDAHLQAYTCTIVRLGLSFLLAGGLDRAELVVVPHGCDSLQGLGSLLLDFVPVGKPVLTLYLPRGERPAADRFLAAELGAMRRRLAELIGHDVTDAELGAAHEREEAADEALARLHADRLWLELGDRDLYRLIRAREYLPAERFTALAEAALAQRRAEPRTGIRVLLSGVVPEPMELFDHIAAAGGLVVADDLLCTGRRLYPRGSSAEPLTRMAESLLGGPPDSTRGSSLAERVAHVRALARASKAQVAVFTIVKFCEPEQFYWPPLREALERDGVRCVMMENDLAEPWSETTSTRLEALLESVS
jgi:benzoyl-CoA reductase/2-hydroxyglutaryl-CoA dehydratase subunit BcrC/BadD/HgdB